MSLKENELNFNCPVRGLIFWAQSQTMRRNLEVKSLHKKQENLTTVLCVLREEHGDHGDFFKGFLSGLCALCGEILFGFGLSELGA
jgi:hypothetical protein